MPLLIATNNAGKLREFRALLTPIQIVGPADLNLDIEVEENGQSFLENAILKATAFSAATNLIALADDSGLEVDARQPGGKGQVPGAVQGLLRLGILPHLLLHPGQLKESLTCRVRFLPG